MRILPVIDLLGGVVVRGVAGERDKYRPVRSVLAGEPTPAAVARAFADTFAATEVYVADLDAIAGDEPAWEDYEAIAAAGLRLWVDAGVADADRASALARAKIDSRPLHRLILGLESLRRPRDLQQIAGALPRERLVFSLDLKDGRPLADSPAWPASPLEIARVAYELGIRQFIVLDLSRVGAGQGTGTEWLCGEILKRWPDVELTGGGGVRSAEDLKQLARYGLSHVLVASALHDGRLTFPLPLGEGGGAAAG